MTSSPIVAPRRGGSAHGRCLPSYEYRHVVTLDETSVVGNAYFACYFSWQGHCRELFLRSYVPSVAAELGSAFTLVTIRSACEFFAELLPFEEVVIRMHLASIVEHKMLLRFSYVRRTDGRDHVVAEGEQEVACMRREEGHLRPAPWPMAFAEALRP
jgi:enediyne biosynthesis thioesterase